MDVLAACRARTCWPTRIPEASSGGQGALRGGADEGEHRGKPVGARRREMLAESDLRDVVRLGRQDLGGRAPGVDAQREVHQAGDDARIARGVELEARG